MADLKADQSHNSDDAFPKEKGNLPKARKRKNSRKSKKKKSTSNSRVGNRPYPRVPLEKTLAVAQAIKDKNGGNTWTGEQIAKALGRESHKASSFYYVLVASNKFGLTEGTNPDGEVSLTDLGREIIYSGGPEEELQAKRKAFLNVDLFRDVLSFYKGSKLPEMQYLGNTLQSKFKLHPDFHEEFSNLFQQNCRYVGLESGGDVDQVTTGASSADASASGVVTLAEPKGKTGLVCFVMMPFAERTQSYPRGFFDEVLNSLIIPAAREAGFEVKTANRQGTEMIHSTIINEVLDADMCVCDMTEHNPNVLFELGMRLSHKKPVALIQAEGTARVFDVDNVLRVWPYRKELWRTTLQKDVPDLTGHIKATWENKEQNLSYYELLRGNRTKTKITAT